MKAPAAKPTPADSPKRTGGSGLRVRIWLSCLTGPLLATAVLAFLTLRTTVTDAEFHWVWLPAALGGAILLGIALAAWLDRGIVRHVRGLDRSMAEGEVNDLRGLPSSSGWGELSSLTIQTQALLARQRQAARTAAEFENLSIDLRTIRDRIDTWARTQVWEPMVPEGGPMGALVGLLNRELPRLSERHTGGRDLAFALASEIDGGIPEAREVAEQAERGFVEATALLTTVRELERLGNELDSILAEPARQARERSAAAERSLEQFRIAAASAIERLVAASGESVAHLAQGISHVHEIGERTRLIANRTTLIALNALTANARPAGATTEILHAELKALASDVREASERVDALTAGIELQTAAARDRMNQVREGVAGALEAGAPAAAAEGDEGGPDPSRVMERVREMIRDAAAKGERLSSAGERVSRAAARLQRRVESEVASVAQLAASFDIESATRGAGPKNGPRLWVVETPVAPEDEAADARAADEAAPEGEAPPAADPPTTPQLRTHEEGQ